MMENNWPLLQIFPGYRFFPSLRQLLPEEWPEQMEHSEYADFGFRREHGEVRRGIGCPFHQDGNARLRNY